MRTAEIIRNTRETQIQLTLTLDCPLSDAGFKGNTGIGFFNHMLNSFCVHGGFSVAAEICGDIDVDCHHTIEDVGIVLGKAFAEILKDKGGIKRYGEAVIPMDESLAQAVIDISGRAYLVINAEFSSPMIGAYDTQMTEEFFRALAFNMGATLHLNLLYGKNDHHKTEALYKAAARAISAATAASEGILSAKGVL